MTTAPVGPVPSGAEPGQGSHVMAVRVAEPGFRQDLRAIKVVLQRELIRFWQDKTRIISAMIQPVLFLFVLGTGLSSLTNRSTGGIDLRTFMFPGVLATSTLFTAMFSSVSIVWDREFGFLREMLVAPVRRSSIMIGKTLGGATVATLQACLVLILAPLVDVPLSVGLVVTVVPEVFLLAVMLTAFGLVIAARIQQMQTVMSIMQMLLLPLSFLSGALYPVNNLPQWLADPGPAQPHHLRGERGAHHRVQPPGRLARGPGRAQPGNPLERLVGPGVAGAHDRRGAGAGVPGGRGEAVREGRVAPLPSSRFWRHLSVCATEW